MEHLEVSGVPVLYIGRTVPKGKQLKCKEYDSKCTSATGWYRNAVRRKYIMKHELLCGVFNGM